MKKYRVYASYVVELYYDIEAEDSTDAIEKAYLVDGGDYTVNNEDGWQIDRAEELKQ